MGCRFSLCFWAADDLRPKQFISDAPVCSPVIRRGLILGYSIPLLPLALAQGIICFGIAVLFGLRLSWGILLALLILLPVTMLFVAIGLLLGSTLSSGPQVGGAGSILINLAAWLSGTWFPLDMIGGPFLTVCRLLPFSHAVDVAKACIQEEYGAILPHLLWVIGYTCVLFAAAVFLFHRKMRQ